MDFVNLGKLALELGVIPSVALFLIVSMHLQNRRLTNMLEKKDQHTFEILTKLVTDLSDLRKQDSASRVPL